MPRQANYEIVENKHASGGPLTIRDLGPWDKHPSVTNVAEEVVTELVAGGALHVDQRLFYYDSEGQLDEIVVRAGRFVGFRFDGLQTACTKALDYLQGKRTGNQYEESDVVGILKKALK